MNKSFKGFKRFVARQKSDKKVDHEDWCGCAVGKYLRKKSMDNDSMGFWVLHNFPENVYYKLGNATDGGPIGTYGKLSKYLQGLKSSG